MWLHKRTPLSSSTQTVNYKWRSRTSVSVDLCMRHKTLSNFQKHPKVIKITKSIEFSKMIENFFTTDTIKTRQHSPRRWKNNKNTKISHSSYVGRIKWEWHWRMQQNIYYLRVSRGIWVCHFVPFNTLRLSDTSWTKCNIEPNSRRQLISFLPGCFLQIFFSLKRFVCMWFLNTMWWLDLDELNFLKKIYDRFICIKYLIDNYFEC